MLAIPVITYSFNIIDWNLNQVKKLNIKIRKMMTAQVSIFIVSSSQEVAEGEV